MRFDEIADVFTKQFGKESKTNFSRNEFVTICVTPDAVQFSAPVQNFLKQYKPIGRGLEGFVFPDTYFFNTTATAKDVVDKMISTLIAKLSSDDLTHIANSKYTFYQTLTVASIIEREAFTNLEKPDIADVFYKRLEEGVDGVRLLQVDAALLYSAKDWKADAFKLKSIDTPYNTYIHPGLTPTPISNPGIAAIRAAINPNPNPYFFYVHDKNGVVHFAKTLAEHNQNVRQYL
jgi:UPF0755 protein